MAEPVWLTVARRYLGTQEKPGKANNPVIVKWFADSNSPHIKDDATAWCAAYVGGVLKEAGYTGSGSVAARSYLNWGKPISKPRVGAITVFKRGNSSWQGHVAFFLRDLGTHIEVLGGNQSNKVSIARYKKADLLGYRWPDDLKSSSVMKGSAVGFTGGSAITADSATELAAQLNDADGHISAGTIFGLVIGLLIAGGALWALYARWNAGGRPVPSWAPEWVKRWAARE